MRHTQKIVHAKSISLSVLESRLKRAVRPKDRLWATISLAKGLLGHDAAQTGQALLLFAEAEGLAETIGERRGAAIAIHGTGRCQLDLTNYAAALDTLKRALPIAEQTGYAECEITILRDMGMAYLRQSRQNLALETLQQCAELAELIGDTQMQASALSTMGSILKNLGQYEKSLEYLLKSFALIEHTGLEYEKALVLLHLSNTLQPLGKYTEALSTLEQIRQLHVPDRRIEGFCELGIGQVYSSIGDYSKALSSLLTATKIIECIGDNLSLGTAYANLMEIYLLLDNTEQMKSFGEKALAIFEEIGLKRGQAAMLIGLGDYYFDQGQKDRAMELSKRCLVLSREIGSKEYEASALITIAKVESTRSFATAQKTFRKALTIASESNDREHSIIALLGLGNLFNKHADPDHAISFLDRAIAIASEIHSRRFEQEAHQMLAEALETKGYLKYALTHWKLASSIREEILGTEKQKTITELQIRSDIEKSEAERALLRKETATKSQDMEKIAMALAEKTEYIRSISRRIKNITQHLDGDKRSEFDTLVSEFEDSPSNNEEKKIFNNGLLFVHQDIIEKLSKRYSNLTPTERKVCLLLRDGFSTKQMSLMLKISSGVIQKHRDHIRKKMKLTRGANLITVLARM